MKKRKLSELKKGDKIRVNYGGGLENMTVIENYQEEKMIHFHQPLFFGLINSFESVVAYKAHSFQLPWFDPS